MRKHWRSVPKLQHKLFKHQSDRVATFATAYFDSNKKVKQNEFFKTIIHTRASSVEIGGVDRKNRGENNGFGLTANGVKFSGVKSQQKTP